MTSSVANGVKAAWADPVKRANILAGRRAGRVARGLPEKVIPAPRDPTAKRRAWNRRGLPKRNTDAAASASRVEPATEAHYIEDIHFGPGRFTLCVCGYTCTGDTDEAMALTWNGGDGLRVDRSVGPAKIRLSRDEKQIKKQQLIDRRAGVVAGTIGHVRAFRRALRQQRLEGAAS